MTFLVTETEWCFFGWLALLLAFIIWIVISVALEGRAAARIERDEREMRVIEDEEDSIIKRLLAIEERVDELKRDAGQIGAGAESTTRLEPKPKARRKPQPKPDVARSGFAKDKMKKRGER